LNGVIHAIGYVSPASQALDTTNVIKIYNERSTGWLLFTMPGSTIPVMYYPATPMHGSTAGVLASTITGRMPCLSHERVKVNVEASSNGSTAKTATLHFYVQGA
jgi:hypothetical protein